MSTRIRYGHGGQSALGAGTKAPAMTMRRIERIGLAAALLVAALLCGAAAAAYPERPVRLLIPFGPGGASDFGGRVVAAGLSDVLGQQVVVDNRGGASGLIATEMAVRAQADGYTLFLGNVNVMAINPHIQRMKFDPVKELATIAPVMSIPTVVVGHVSVKGNTLKEYLDEVLRSKREIRYGTATLASPGRFIMVSFLKAQGIKLLEVPFNGAGPATTALLAGEMEILPVT
ncbi:MAG: tripartite tricarboxylate transporter substrate binding protein [Betaproteobacteria bacterium]|nr:tripartite tricarboxylate transporter substrate binding protein [Betaproteobacteria bacterium]